MTTQRFLGALLTLVAVAGGVAGSTAVRRHRERGIHKLADRLAQSARVGARDWLSDKLKSLEGQASVAASLTPLKQNVVSFDAATLKDGFREEAWWEPTRREFSVFGLALDTDKLEAIEGMSFGELDAGELVRAARTSRQTAAFLRAGIKEWPYAAAAAIVDVPRSIPAVLVIARPVDQAFAQEMADRLGRAVLLSDGHRALLLAGAAAEREQLKAVVGKESQALVAAPDGRWASAPTPLMKGLTLWTYAGVTDAAELESDSGSGSIAVWGMAALLGAVGLALLVRGGRPKATAAPPALVPASGQAGVTPGAAAVAPGGMLTPRGATGITPSDTRPGPTGTSDPKLLELESEGATVVRAAPGVGTGPNVFGRYRLLDRLGEGGMAEVFTAVAYGVESFRRTFVIKRLRAELMRNADVVSAFIDEANLASSLVHNNIVPVFDFGKVGEEYYMATEYIVGRDLGRMTRRSMERDQHPLPMPLVFYAAQQTLEALDYAHHKTDDHGKPLGIVHRDVSPNNILVSARGEVKLFDFGIAKAEGRLTQTQAGMVKGNVRFMSPEQARGQPVDSRSDLFSMGLVIYYALSGDALYEAGTGYDLLVKAASGPGGEELAQLAKLPAEAQRILERALQTNPSDRFQTAAEFAQALAPFVNGQKEQLLRTMDRLFAEDIRAEQEQLVATAASTSEPPKAPLAVKPDPEGATAHFAAPKDGA